MERNRCVCWVWFCFVSLFACVEGEPTNEDCNKLTFDEVPNFICMASCVEDCRLKEAIYKDHPDTCTCEKTHCKNFEESCSESEKKVWQIYADAGCVTNTLEGRCSKCVSSGCTFCDRRNGEDDRVDNHDKTRISFCWYGLADDPVYGKCDGYKNQEPLRMYSQSDDSNAICSEENETVPAGLIILYIIIYAICPICVFGACIYMVFFGAAAFFSCLRCGHRIAVSTDDEESGAAGTQNGFSGQGAAPNRCMVVIPSDSSPAQVSEPVHVGLQMAVAVNTADFYKGGSTEITGPVTSSAGAGGDKSDTVPIAYAQPL